MSFIVKDGNIVEFMGKDVVPVDPDSGALATALFELLQAKKELDEAKDSVPNYTAQYSSEDYYAAEEENYNRKAEKFKENICSLIDKMTKN